MAAKYIVTFHSVYWAMEAERALRSAGLDCRLRPVPRQFSSSCGICAEVTADSQTDIAEALAASNLQHDETFGPM